MLSPSYGLGLAHHAIQQARTYMAAFPDVRAPARGRGGGTPDLELELQLLRARLAAGQRGQQEIGGARAALLERLRDRREPGVAGELDVVEADDGQPLGHLEAGAGGGLDDP